MTFEQGHALLIGVGNHTHHPHLNVPITAADAEAVAAVVTNPNYCGYPAGQCTVLTNEAATQEGVSAALDHLGQLSPQATVFIFFAGHGGTGTDGLYYLLTHDVKMIGNKVKAGTGISQKTLLKKLRAIQAERCIMFFNACHSGHIGPGSLAMEEPVATLNPSGKVAHAILDTGGGRIVIVASKKEQKAYFTPGAPTTIFTEKLISGLQGEAAWNEGYIGAFGLYQYIFHEVKETVQSKYGFLQEPVITAIQTVGAFPIALYQGASDLGAFGSEARKLDGTAPELISSDRAERAFENSYNINTGGGTYIGGNVNTGGGDFIGRDQHIKGDYVRGNKSGERSVNVGGNVSGNIVTGDRNVISQTNNQLDEIAAAFTKLQKIISQAPLNSAEEKVAETAVENLRMEAQKGEQAEEIAVQSWFTFLVNMHSDIAEVAIETFRNPIKGLGTVFQKVAEKARG